jgi:hypothetical protein
MRYADGSCAFVGVHDGCAVGEPSCDKRHRDHSTLGRTSISPMAWLSRPGTSGCRSTFPGIQGLPSDGMED